MYELSVEHILSLIVKIYASWGKGFSIRVGQIVLVFLKSFSFYPIHKVDKLNAL